MICRPSNDYGFSKKTNLWAIKLPVLFIDFFDTNLQKLFIVYWDSIKRSVVRAFLILPVLNKYQSSGRTASWRPNNAQSDKSHHNPQCRSSFWREKQKHFIRITNIGHNNNKRRRTEQSNQITCAERTDYCLAFWQITKTESDIPQHW